MILSRLQELSRRRARFVFSTRALATAAGMLAALFAVAWVDSAYGLPWAVRLGVLLGILVAGGYSLRRASWAARGAAERETARLVESAHPEFGQSVRTAAEVAPKLQASSGALEIELVKQTAGRLKPLPLEEEVAPRGRFYAAAGGALAMAACWIAAMALSSDWRTAAARSLALPLSYTRVRAEATPAQVRGEETARVLATLSGRASGSAVAYVRSEGEAWRPVAMTPVAPQQFDLALPTLEKSLEFYVCAGDGRSAPGRVEVYRAPRLGEIIARLSRPRIRGQRRAKCAPAISKRWKGRR